MFHEVGLVHTDAGVGNGKGLGLFIETDVYSGIEGKALVGVIGDVEVLELVEGVGGIGYKLAKENLLVGIEGVDDEVEKAANLCLKLMCGHLAVLLGKSNFFG